MLAIAAALAIVTPAQALITPTVTVDGPPSGILDFGGVAMAPDGSGGLTYVKAVEGVPHIFASRYDGDSWSAPIRVDWDQPFDASQPRIAAGADGALLVVWVTQVATVHNQIRRGLYSASIGPGASGFGPSLLVDPNVGEGIGVDPSVSATAPGKAIVAYRAITYTFNPNVFSTAVQLRPGDVMADIRLARLDGDRWSRIGAINRNPEASMRPPSAVNGPRVATGVDGGAVVAWQEPDQSGAARIWVRRVFGTTPGPVLEASPASWEGKPIDGDADALSLSVAPLGQARMAIRVAGASGARSGSRLFLNSLPPGFSLSAGAMTGAKLAFSASPSVGALGPPDIAASEKGGREGALRLAFTAGAQVRQVAIDEGGALVAVPAPAGPPARIGAEAMTAVNPEGGGVLVYPALDARGRQVVAARQEFASSAAQTGLLSSAGGGPIAELSIGPSGGGDALVAFRQGVAGDYGIVAERVSAPPASFQVTVPPAWVRPSRARLHWQPAPSAIGGLTYAVVLNGRITRRGLRRLRFLPPRGVLGSGVLRVQVLATDGLGQQLLSSPGRLRVDANPPRIHVDARRAGRLVVVGIRDPDSGLRPASSLVSFGDGTGAHGGSKFHHSYAHSGRYTIVIRARDRVGNNAQRHLQVRVP